MHAILQPRELIPQVGVSFESAIVADA